MEYSIIIVIVLTSCTTVIVWYNIYNGSDIPVVHHTTERVDNPHYQTKYRHNVTKSDGRAAIFNDFEECKLWGAENRVIGAIEADLGELPCIALLEYLVAPDRYSFECTGALINHRYVLTAAKCLLKQKLVNVRLGEYDITKTPDCADEGDCQPEVINVGIEQIIVHQKYLPSISEANDIGLIRLSTDVPYENYFIKPICIPDETISSAIGEVAKVAGWGSDDLGRKSSVLRSVWVEIADLGKCREIYEPQQIYPSQLCAGGARDRNACGDDIGSPLLIRYNKRSYIEGIVSISSGCIRNGKPDVYTRVSYYFDWIQDNLKP